MKRILIALALAAAAAPAAADGPADLGELEWLAGIWVAETGRSWTEERWAPARGGVMLGTSLSGKGEAASGYEFMRIAADGEGRIAFWGAPEGKPAVPFRLVSAQRGEAVFENPTHDFPTRIVYRRTGSGMTATVSGPDGANRQTWRYKRR
jgi:Domain of unknown function (DUF6265)